MRLSGEHEQDLLARTRKHASRIVKVYTSLPKQTVPQVFGTQLLRSGTSVGAQLAESAHGKSRADFVSKIVGALQELEESRFWMLLLIEEGLVTGERLQPLMDETTELIKILVTIAHRSHRPPKGGSH